MTERLTIRVAQQEDAATIHAGLVALAAGLGSASKVTSTIDDIARHGFGTSPAFDALIAEFDGTFAGMCLSFASFSTWRGEPGVYVQDLYVDPALRGRRIGARLLKAAARRGQAAGARYLRLSVDAANAGAQAFYNRLGISHRRDEQIHMISGEGFDALALEQEDER